METITSLFADIIALQKSMGYNMADYLLPGLTKEELQNYEKQLGLKFSDEIFEFYYNTGGIVGTDVSMGQLCLLPLNIIASFDNVFAHLSAMKEFVPMFSDYFETNGLNYFCFLIDGGAGKYWVDLNHDKQHGKLIKDFGAGETPEYTFNSIKSYLYFVKHCYINGAVFIEDDGCLEWDFDKFHEYREGYLANQIT